MKYKTEKMKKKVLIIFVLLVAGLYANAQRFSHFKKWNSRLKIDASEIVFAVDSSSTEMGMEFLMKVVDRTAMAINNAGIETRITTQPDTLVFRLNESVLTIRFTLNKPVYVFGRLPDSKDMQFHACNSIIFTQVFPRTSRKMDTVLSISIDDEDNAINELVENLSSDILKTLSR